MTFDEWAKDLHLDRLERIAARTAWQAALQECADLCEIEREKLGMMLVHGTSKAHDKRDGEFAGIHRCLEAIRALRDSRCEPQSTK